LEVSHGDIIKKTKFVHLTQTTSASKLVDTPAVRAQKEKQLEELKKRDLKFPDNPKNS